MKPTVKLIAFILSLTLLLCASACSSGETPAPSSSAVPSSGPINLGDNATGVELGVEVIEAGVWDGTVADRVAKGGGLEDAPFLIYSPAELAWALTEGSGEGYYFQLECDIYLNDVSSKTWFENDGLNVWEPSSSFDGHIDGNGHVIYGIYIPAEDRPSNAGLVQKFTEGSFKNLGIRYSYIVAGNYAGAFAGYTSGRELRSFENCFVDETVYVQYVDDGTNGAGGFVGIAEGKSESAVLTFKNCYSKAQAAGLVMDSRVNGIIGTSWDCSYTMENCYCTGYAPYYATNARTVSTLNGYGTSLQDIYKNVYSTGRAASGSFERYTQLSLSKLKGDAAKQSLSGFDFDNVWETVADGTPKLRVFAGYDGKTVTGMKDMYDVQVIISDFSSGRGTEKDPYVITDGDQLRKAVTGGYSGFYFVLGNDIYVNDTTKANWINKAEKWEQSKSKKFAGNFDGKGYTVYGLYYEDTPDDTGTYNGIGLGLFPVITTTAVIKNVRISQAYLSGEGCVGGVAGIISGGNSTGTQFAVISNCYVDDTCVLSGQNVGGIFGSGGGCVDISYCAFTGTISKATREDGGMVGDIWSKNYKITQSYSVGHTTYRGNYLPNTISAVYGTVSQNGIITVSNVDIQGSSAKTAMPDLDWSKWTATSGYPIPNGVK